MRVLKVMSITHAITKKKKKKKKKKSSGMCKHRLSRLDSAHALFDKDIRSSSKTCLVSASVVSD